MLLLSIKSIAFLLSLSMLVLGQSNTPLYKQCLCDVSSVCDNQCCCDTNCSQASITLWNAYSLCSNDGLIIPFCASFYNQSPHLHDLYSGLRTIYTVIQRLFCIQKVNFADPTTSYISSSSDAQTAQATTISSTPSLNPSISSLTVWSGFQGLPSKDGMGRCSPSTVGIYDMNSFSDRCRSLTSQSDINSNSSKSMLTVQNIPSFLSGIRIFNITNATASSTASNTSAVTTTCPGTTCFNVIRQFKLTFTKTSSSATPTVDLSSSYIVVGSANLASSSTPAYLTLVYSYQFNGPSKAILLSSNKGYSMGAPLQLIKGTTTKIYNPINLAFRAVDGTCRVAGVDSSSDFTNLITIKFGQNSVHSCSGSTNVINTNLMGAFDSVGSIGSATTNSFDYVAVSFSGVISASQSVQLIFYYISIGTSTSPQYKVVNAATNPIDTKNNQPSLFIEFISVANSVVINTPSPPVLNAYLPNDFLYPFYAA